MRLIPLIARPRLVALTVQSYFHPRVHSPVFSLGPKRHFTTTRSTCNAIPREILAELEAEEHREYSNATPKGVPAGWEGDADPASTKLVQSSCFTFFPSMKRKSSHLAKAIQQQSIPPGRIPLVVVLSTPEHCGSFHNDPEAIQSLLENLFPNPAADQRISVLNAVIDVIPWPSKTELRLSQVEDSTQFAQLSPLEGQQGISIAVLDEKHAAPDIWSNENISAQLPPDDGVLPHLRFDFSDNEKQTMRLQLPLANTIFHNGKSSTMAIQQWRHARSTSGSVGFSLRRSVNVVQQALYMPSHPSPSLLPTQSSFLLKRNVSFNTNLRIITPPRIIAAASGNILRQLKSSEGTSQPASQELEVVVNSLSRKGEIVDGPAEIWALVVPPQHHNPNRRRWAFGEGSQPFDFKKGSRLFRVLSGGGGWGQKQGLLSLDPVADFAGKSSSGPEKALQGMTIFPDLFKSGDTVTFLLYEPTETIAQKEQIEERLTADDNLLVMKCFRDVCKFGCLPSNIDDIPGRDDVNNGTNEEMPHTVVANYFGGLSTRGLVLQVRDESDPEDSNKDRIITSTKVDAPSTTISVFGGYGLAGRKAMPGEVTDGSESPRVNSVKEEPDDPDDEDVTPPSDDPESRLMSLEATYRSSRGREGKGNTNKIRFTSSSTSAEDLFELENDSTTFSGMSRANAGSTLGVTNSGSRPGPTSDVTAGQGMIHKYPVRDHGHATDQAFQTYRAANMRMSKSEQLTYQTALLQGFTTAEASKRIGRDIDTKGKLKGKDKPTFRIRKHSSISPVGEAIEKHMANKDRSGDSTEDGQVD